ncbi:hypothetical protein E2C01_045635 [Portunus trituberculatus]|uniref:Uncharacterized protein n=1 Tax=Portunus trituberculatus TaxID=210409 RepID=A0A5B7FWB5_PORTR|nr:hypothetical protein [Portunus trituberculatus]
MSHIRPRVAQRGTGCHAAAEPRPSGAAPPSATRCKEFYGDYLIPFGNFIHHGGPLSHKGKGLAGTG